MYEIDQTYLAYELAYRTERLTGHRAGEHVRPTLGGRSGVVRRLRGAGRTTDR
jgi:hypothetical protein